MRRSTRLWTVLMILVMGVVGLPAAMADICAICGKEIQGTIYIATDKVTGDRVLVCSNCLMTLPRCYLCGLPIRAGDEVELPDGRYLCARDAKTVVLDTNQIPVICAQVKDDLDQLFSRFTAFPTNVDIGLIDRLDVEAMSGQSGYDVESPDILGVTHPFTDADGHKRYTVSLMTAMPLAELKATCAHEYSHTWVGENVSRERHARIARDAEEGFCEMVAYLLMESQQEDAQEKFILKNLYTRGQVELFIAAEKEYGFDEILDWMRYGTTSELVAGHLDAIRDVQIPAATPATAGSPPVLSGGTVPAASAAVIPQNLPPPRMKLNGIMWGNPPVAIIAGQSFYVGDIKTVKDSGTNVTIRCVAIQKSLVQIVNTDSGEKQELTLPAQ